MIRVLRYEIAVSKMFIYCISSSKFRKIVNEIGLALFPYFFQCFVYVTYSQILLYI